MPLAFCDSAWPRCAPSPKKATAQRLPLQRATGKPRQSKNPRRSSSSLDSCANRGASLGTGKASRVSCARSWPSANQGSLARESSSRSSASRCSIQRLSAAMSGPYQALGASMREGRPGGKGGEESGKFEIAISAFCRPVS